MVSHLEVSARHAADWEQVILVGFTAWRQLHTAGGRGTLTFDLLARTLEVATADLYMYFLWPRALRHRRSADYRLTSRSVRHNVPRQSQV